MSAIRLSLVRFGGSGISKRAVSPNKALEHNAAGHFDFVESFVSAFSPFRRPRRGRPFSFRLRISAVFVDVFLDYLRVLQFVQFADHFSRGPEAVNPVQFFGGKLGFTHRLSFNADRPLARYIDFVVWHISSIVCYAA
jgi:hypothetical protein